MIVSCSKGRYYRMINTLSYILSQKLLLRKPRG